MKREKENRVTVEGWGGALFHMMWSGKVALVK